MIAMLFMAAVLVGMMYLMPEWSQGNMLMRMLRLMGVVIAGAGAYFAALYALGFRLRDFAQRSL